MLANMLKPQTCHWLVGTITPASALYKLSKHILQVANQMSVNTRTEMLVPVEISW